MLSKKKNINMKTKGFIEDVIVHGIKIEIHELLIIANNHHPLPKLT